MNAPTKLIALVGMPGSGKSVAAHALEDAGCAYVRFGQITIDTLASRGLPITPENERAVREELRARGGMGAFASLAVPLIDERLAAGHVAVDGLYSWSEYKILKERYGHRLVVIAIYASPERRYERLARRTREALDTAATNRPLTPAQARERDAAEIEHLEKGGPIAMADYTIINERLTPEELREEVRSLAGALL